MSDEPKFDGKQPDPLSDLAGSSDAVNQHANANVLAPLLPAAPQFASRREARDAAAAASGKPATRRPAPAASGSTRPASTGSSPTGPTSTGPTAPRSVKLSRRDQAAIKRQAATPAIVSPAATKPRAKKQNPIKVFFVLLVITGFVAGIAVPMAASGATLTGATGVTTSYKNAQSVKVSASIDASKVSRDSISATSESELRTEQINSRALADNPGARQSGDDYPWRLAGYGLSPLGYYYRQCVDFVAWRLNRDAGVTSAPWKYVWSNLTPNGGDASQWKSAWENHGWKVSKTPVVGSVAWFVGDHVAYVHSISGSNVTIEEYNGEASRAYAERTIPISSVGDFLYPPS